MSESIIDYLTETLEEAFYEKLKWHGIYDGNRIIWDGFVESRLARIDELRREQDNFVKLSKYTSPYNFFK